MGKMAKLGALLIAMQFASAANAQAPGTYYGPGAGNFLMHPRADRFYGGVEGGVLGLGLPGFNFFQIMDDTQNHLAFVETDDGQDPAGMVGGVIGFCSADRYSFEARGFYSGRDASSSDLLVDGPGASVGFTDIDGGFLAFSNLNGVALATNTSRELVFANCDVLGKYDIWVGQGFLVTSYGGFSMFHLDQTIDANGIYLLPGGAPSGDGVILHEEWTGSYFGVVFGFETLRSFGEYSVGIDASLGFYQLDADRYATETKFGPNIGNSSPVIQEGANHGAISGRLNLELTRHFGWWDLVLFGSLNYLSAVPVVEYAPAAATIPPSGFTTDSAGWYTAGARVIVPF